MTEVALPDPGLPLVRGLRTAYDAGYHEAFGISKAEIDWNEVLDEASDYARAHAGELIAGVKNTRIVQAIIARSIDESWPDARVRAAIARTVGLDQRSQNALNNYEKQLIKDHVPLGRQGRMVDAYAKRLKANRVRTIAQNEIAMAHAAGKRAAWRRMRSMGEVSPQAVRVWRTHKDERTCEVCAPLNGRRAGLDEGRVYTFGRPTRGRGGRSRAPVQVPGPPAHVNCRCWEELVDLGTPEVTP